MAGVDVGSSKGNIVVNVVASTKQIVAATALFQLCRWTYTNTGLVLFVSMRPPIRVFDQVLKLRPGLERVVLMTSCCSLEAAYQYVLRVLEDEHEGVSPAQLTEAGSGRLSAFDRRFDL